MEALADDQAKVLSKIEEVKEQIGEVTGAMRSAEEQKQRALQLKMHDANVELTGLKTKVHEVEISVETLVKAVLQARAAKSAKKKRDMIRRSSVQLMNLFKQGDDVHDRARKRKEQRELEQRREA